MSTLLEAIWDGGVGLRCLMFRHAGDKTVKHYFFDTAAEAQARAVMLSNSQNDVWFAPSIFIQNERTQDCVATTKALWLDIDVGPGKDYKTRDSMIGAFNQFLSQTNLPDPTIVESGNGAHVYWILHKALTPEEWKPLAEQLRNACKKFNLKADHACTCDSARVLRVPGTFNYKDPEKPKAVLLFADIETCAVETMQDRLAPFKNIKSEKEAKKLNAKFGAVDLPSLPKDANKIADECAQMKLMRDTKGNIPEPQWYAGLGVLALCENGEALAHEWSKGHPTYSHGATAEKFERSREFAPTTCDRFGAIEGSDLCNGCSYRGSIGSPIKLGEYVAPKIIKVERQDTQQVEAIPVPKFYEVGDTGVWFTPPKGKDDGDEEPKRKLIIFCPLYVSRVMLNESDGASEVEIVWATPRGKERKASFKQALLARPTDLNAELKSYNIQIPPRALDHAINYLQAGIILYIKDHDEETVYDRFGWHESGFIVGSDRVHAGGLGTARISESVDKRRLVHLGTKGDVSSWANATNLLDEARFWQHRFAVLVALASPLLRLSDSEGSVLSLSGESGGGKTTSAAFGMSAFGNPKGMAINPQSTENAFYEFWRLMSNLPVLCNEAVTMDERKLGLLVYAAANGEARDRLQRDGKMKDAGDFATVTILTNNKHILALPDKVLNDATRRRILELTFDKNSVMPLTIGTELNRVMRMHYGHAGRIFLQYVMQNRETVQNQIIDLTAKLEKGIHSANRYNVWLVSAATVTYEIASKLGLIKFGYADALQNVLSIIRTQDTSIVGTVQRVADAVTRYVQTYQGYITYKSTGKRGGWKEYVKGEVRARYTIEADGSHTLCLPLEQFREWALERNIDNAHIKQWEKDLNIVSRSERIAPLTNPVKCLIITGFKEGEE